ncbi:hypothetical protein B0H19DRAFT_1125199 [Mycena capillaripes]|nr:hypothetical protein B0H19DRAFT_1125199 [Mycena capillaripes]
MARTPSKPSSKPHVPYRGDDPTVGKKTGFKVANVERTSDGFEKFHDLLDQADGRTPPRRKKKRVSDAGEEEDEDEDGEASMDVDSPVHYTTTPRATTSSRPISRGAAVDFDAVPSPRARKPVSHAQVERELLQQDESTDDGGMDNYDQRDDFGGGDEEEEEEQPPVQSPKGKGKATAAPTPTPNGKSKSTAAPTPTPKGKSKNTAPPAPTPKGKGRALPPVDEEDEDEMEDDIARGMEDVDQAASDEDEEEEERLPPKKKIRSTPAPTAKPKQIKSRPQKENRDGTFHDYHLRYRRLTRHTVPDGVRRSQRKFYPPLEFWRGEKVTYAPRDPSHKRLCPHIQDIVRIPKEPPAPRRAGSKRKRGGTRAQTTPEVVEREVIVEIDASNPEAGWDDDSNPTAVVLDYRTGDTVTRRVAFTAKMFNPQSAKVSGPDDGWSFEKIFGDGDFMAAGQLVIPTGKRKPGKGTKDNTYVRLLLSPA